MSGFIIIQFSLIQLSRYLLKCRLNSTGANYKTSTKTQTKHKCRTNAQKQITKQKKNKNNMAGKRQHKSTKTEVLNPAKFR